MELMALLSGLAAAMSWGAADFAGGVASRHAAAVRVVLASQIFGTLALAVWGLYAREAMPGRGELLWGAVAGLAGGVGLMLLYLSLARGKMGVAAPLTAVASGGVPLLVGLATEGLPGPAQLAGFVAALASIWIISRPEEGATMRPADVFLPLLAGVGFGAFLAILGRLGESAGIVWPLMAARAASISLMSAVVLAGWWRARGRSGHPRVPFPWALAALAGLGDTAGNALFVYSTQTGRLDVAAVLGALYPAGTVLLAWVVLGERLSPRQSVGVGVALAAVALIAL